MSLTASEYGSQFPFGKKKKVEYNDEEESRSFHSDTDTMRRVKDGLCGFTRKLCDEIYLVRHQHNGSSRINSQDPDQCEICHSVVEAICTSTLSPYYVRYPNGGDLARGYIIYGSKLLTMSQVNCGMNTGYTLASGLKAKLKRWNTIARVNSREYMVCSFQVMTNEHNLYKKDYGTNSNPPPPLDQRLEQRFTYSITLQWREPMYLRIVRFIADIYYPNSEIVSLWK